MIVPRLESNAIHRDGRQTVARLMTDLCDAKISGREFLNGMENIEHWGDPALEMAVDWTFDTFLPDFQRLKFDSDHPPYRIRRQFALFRRFLLGYASYQWPPEAFRFDSWPTLRLLAAGVACAGVLLGIGSAIAFPVLVPLTLFFFVLSTWLLGREKAASQTDQDRLYARARQFGDPEAWPFLTFSEFRKVGPARRLWARRNTITDRPDDRPFGNHFPL
jgi:hypothetical protein